MKIDIITGCDSGIGKALISKYIEENKPVIYSFLETDHFIEQKNCFGFNLDLRSEISIENFCKKVNNLLKQGYEIGTLFNNAGIALGGSVENLPLYIYREIMEVNFFGLINLTQHFIPEIIQSKGRIIIHGSMAGVVTLPYLSAYAASKHAEEALADSLRRELYRDGVQVSIVQTGGVATPIWFNAEKQDFSFLDKKYEINTFIKNFVKPAQNSMPVERAAADFYKILKKKKLNHRYRVANNAIRNYLLNILPTGLIDYIFRKLSGLNY